MTQDEIIEAAKEAGFVTFEGEKGDIEFDTYSFTLAECLAKFAELILASQIQPTPSQSELTGWTSDDIDDTNCNSDTLEQFCRDNIRLAPFFAMLAAKLSAQPTPSQSEPVAWNFEYDQLTEEFIHELDDKTAITISGFNRGYWAQYFNYKPQPTSQEVGNNPNSAVLSNGKTCTNVYEAYEIGKAETHHKPQPTPSQSEIGAFAKAISKQAVEDYKASLVPAAYFLRESYDGTDEYNQTDPTVNKAMPLYELGETK